jgi:phospholipase C
MDFFASHYAICDHWFSAIPTGTQPNRFMAMAGVTPIDTNKGVLAFPDQDTVYDWLNKRGIRWRVYSGGLPFFFLMDKWRGKMLTDDEHFRNVANLARDVQEEDDSSYPQVIFVEPCYTDDPFHGPKNDDHPTTPIDRGQEFLADTYRALASSPKRWKRTVVILTYDEHGGFFDHVSPLPVITNAPNGEYAPFTSTGPRVPAFVLSPLVAPRTVYKDPLDHTAILRFLGEKFDNGSYSKDVDARSISGRISSLLKLTTPRNDVPMPHPPSGILPRMSINSEAFLAAGKAARANATAKARRRFPGLWSV